VHTGACRSKRTAFVEKTKKKEIKRKGRRGKRDQKGAEAVVENMLLRGRQARNALKRGAGKKCKRNRLKKNRVYDSGKGRGGSPSTGHRFIKEEVYQLMTRRVRKGGAYKREKKKNSR